MTLRGFKYVSMGFGVTLLAAGLNATPIGAQQLGAPPAPLDDTKIAQFQQVVASELGVTVDSLQAAQQAAVSVSQSGPFQVQGPSTSSASAASAGGALTVVGGGAPGKAFFMVDSSDPNDPFAQAIAAKLNVSAQQLEQAYKDAATRVGLKMPASGADGTLTQVNGPDAAPLPSTDDN